MIPVLVLARQTVRSILGRLWVQVAVGLCSLAAGGISFALFVILSQNLPAAIERRFSPFLGSAVYPYYLLTVSHVVSALLALTASPAISQDRRTGALTLILSRPISPCMYFLGRGLGVVFIPVLVTLVPCVFLLGSVFVFRRDPDLDPGRVAHILAASVASSAAIILPAATGILALSAGFRTNYSAAVGWFGLYVGSLVLAEILSNATGDPQYELLSFYHNWRNFAAGVFPAVPDRSEPRNPWWESLLVLAAFSAASVGWIAYRVRQWGRGCS